MKNDPLNWQSRLQHVPMLGDAEDWELLRKWSLSEVWRVSFAEGRSVIVKCGRGAMSRELAVYLEILAPFNIHAPRLIHHFQDKHASLLVLEDLKGVDLETVPEAHHFITAAKGLARIRNQATKTLRQSRVKRQFVLSEEWFLRALRGILQAVGRKWDEACSIFSFELAILFRNSPMNIVHSDFHAKNLVVRGEQICAIDWANAYVAPHMGDLYCLVNEYQHHHPSADIAVLLDAYLNEREGCSFKGKHMQWHLVMGGICWHIQAVDWLIKEGRQYIPAAESWLPEMFDTLFHLIDHLQAEGRDEVNGRST
ncbi:phosphotransferase [Thalassobacillus sp. CUG 92003]|uniref:phosphotransferase n=1 Tax=Thalassobacillus sp. CUG 92003 TaxID=2736641 RepID=UPI0015E63018|nr:phosphotransferase [Thalassobacillus sp. CUG 92003]